MSNEKLFGDFNFKDLMIPNKKPEKEALEGFIDQLDAAAREMQIVMEADDITGETSNEVAAVTGRAPGGNRNTQNDEVDAGADDADDISQTDDIFGFNDNNENKDGDPQGNPEADNEEGGSDSNMNPDPGTGDTDPNMQDDNNDNVTDDQINDIGSDDAETGADAAHEDPKFADKNRIRDNMVQLHGIIQNTIETLVNSMNLVDDKNTIEVFNLVLNRLRNAESYLYKTVTQNIKDMDYEEMYQRYITLQRVYDICREMIKVHFDYSGKDLKKLREENK